MVTVRESVFIKFENGVSVERMELDIGSVEELPYADFMQDHLLYQGSIARDISTGKFYSINSAGTWFAQDGSGVVVPDENDYVYNDHLIIFYKGTKKRPEIPGILGNTVITEIAGGAFSGSEITAAKLPEGMEVIR